MTFTSIHSLDLIATDDESVLLEIDDRVLP